MKKREPLHSLSFLIPEIQRIPQCSIKDIVEDESKKGCVDVWINRNTQK